MSRIRAVRSRGRARALFAAIVSFGGSITAMVACGGDDQTPDVAGETGGGLFFETGGAAPTGGAPNGGTGASATGAGGSSASGPQNGGSISAGGNVSTAGTGPSGGAAGAAGGSANTGGTASGGLPPGSVCANDSNCSQSAGPAVCCVAPGCGGPCECRLTADCPTGTPFLPCNSAADCAAFGGGKVCCKATSGGQTMQYCTKENGCPGVTLP